MRGGVRVVASAVAKLRDISRTSSETSRRKEREGEKVKDRESDYSIRRLSRYQSHQGDKYATPDSTRGRIDDGPLRADHRRLFMLYWAAWASDVLITPLVLNESSAL